MKPHPNKVFEGLCKATENPRCIKNLTVIHEICREMSSQQTKDYTPARIGRMAEARGGPSLNTLYSTKGAHFRKLISAWATWDGLTISAKKTIPATSATNPSDEEILQKIDDAVIRSFVGPLLAERRRLLTNEKTLKALAAGQPVIDLRPVVTKGSGQILEANATLTKDERESLQNVTDPKWLQAQKLREGPRGELLDLHDRVIMQRGSLPGIRKLLGSERKEK